jgi:hypothetical protein
MEEMLETILRHRLYGLAAEIRAVEEGHNARVLPDGSILVKAESNPGSYRVFIRGIDDGVLRFGCTCRSGEYRTSLPVPCKHAALAAWSGRAWPAGTTAPGGCASGRRSAAPGCCWRAPSSARWTTRPDDPGPASAIGGCGGG